MASMMPPLPVVISTIFAAWISLDESFDADPACAGLAIFSSELGIHARLVDAQPSGNGLAADADGYLALDSSLLRGRSTSEFEHRAKTGASS